MEPQDNEVWQSENGLCCWKWSKYLNGWLLFGIDDWWRPEEIDQYVAQTEKPVLRLLTADGEIAPERLRGAGRMSAKITPTAMVRDDDPEATDAASAVQLLGPARIVLDRCAEARPGSQEEAAAMSQRIVDLIGHSTTDEPPRALVELQALRDERQELDALLMDCLRPLGEK